MANVIPFKSWQPQQEFVLAVAAAPYDTLSRAEAAREIQLQPLSFLRIDKPAALFGSEVDEYDPCIYRRAKEELDAWFAEQVFVPAALDDAPVFCVYRLTQGSHVQTGLVACASVADYQSGVIKRHENTRAHKEQDRVDHISALQAHTSPVLLTYPSVPALAAVLSEIAASAPAHYDFVASDQVRHEYWLVTDAARMETIRTLFAAIPTLYIADGHHRAAAAARVAKELAEAGDLLESHYFLAALFGSDELQVLDYNRVVSDLAGQSPEEVLERIGEVIQLEFVGATPYRPTKRGEFGMYLAGSWYRLLFDEAKRPHDAVECLDVSLLQERILAPIFALDDPRSDPRIAYVGGARGLEELAERANRTEGVAFSLYPCSLAELFAVADANRLMPAKSTWFDPKPKSGLAIHRISE